MKTITETNLWGVICKSIFLGICIISAVDTKLFIYNSLSFSMLEIIGTVLLLFSICILCFKNGIESILKIFDIRRNNSINIVYIYMAYMLIFHITVPCEIYRTYYLLGNLLLCLTIYISLKLRVLNWDFISNIFILLICINLVYVYAQWIGITQSHSSFFKVSGISDNPSVSAIFLSASSFILFRRLAGPDKSDFSNFKYWALLFLIIHAIIILKCRTAVVGLLLYPIIYYFLRDKKITTKYVLVMFLFLIVILSILGLDYKIDSTSGRLLVWKISLSLLSTNLLGLGYGTFERNYNLAQSEYFNSEERPIAEVMNADHVFMPYNDLVEHAIDSGILGAILFLTFWGLVIYKAFSLKRVHEFAGLMSLFIMSMINFVYTSVESMLLISCLSGLIFFESDEKGQNLNKQSVRYHSGRLVFPMILFLCCFLAIRESQMIYGQYKLKNIVEEIKAGFLPDENKFSSIQNSINTSEAFYTEYAKYHISKDSYHQALDKLNIASRYSSSSKIFVMKSYCYQEQGEYEKAVVELCKLKYMMPHHLFPNLLLMRVNNRFGKRDEAVKYADVLIGMPLKISSSEADKIIEEAKYTKYEK